MGLDTKDVEYFDGKFGKLHGRIDNLGEKVDAVKLQTALTANEVDHVKADLICHKKKPCKNVGDHYGEEHKPQLGRILKVVAVIVGIVGTTVGVIAFLM